MDIFKDFIIDKMPAAVIILDQSMKIVFSNKQAKLFFKYQYLPDEVRTICRRIFDAIDISKLKESFPGDIHLTRNLDDSPSQWSFKIQTCEEPEPFVTVYIIEESLADKIDFNLIRDRFKLTRRESDVFRRAISGLKSIDIADDLGISEHTVRDHLSSIYVKLGVERRTELASVFLKLAGIIKSTDPLHL